MFLILILWQLLIQLLMQLLILMATLTLILKLMLKLTLLRLLIAHPLAVTEEEEERFDSALSNSVLEDADGRSPTSSARLQFSHGRRDYGLVVLSPAERPDTPNIRWCSRR